jgi:hypothetical protein
MAMMVVAGFAVAKHRPARSQQGSGVAGGPQRGQYQRRARPARTPRPNLLRRGHAGEAHQVPEEVPAQGEQQGGEKYFLLLGTILTETKLQYLNADPNSGSKPMRIQS